jgi:hypothetical protein
MKNLKLYKIIKERFDYVDGDLIYKDGRRAGKIAGGYYFVARLSECED